MAAYAETLPGAVQQQLGDGVRLLVEPGRSLVGNAGITAYRVVSVKRDAVVHVAVDGGMGDNLEPSLYGTAFEARLLHSREPSERCQVVGKHCESGDVLVHGAELPQAQPGDLLVTPATGAYCFTMANNYNGQPRPPVVFCRDGDARLVVRRETLADLAARDVARRRLVPGLHVPRVRRQVRARAELLVVEVQVQVVGLQVVQDHQRGIVAGNFPNVS